MMDESPPQQPQEDQRIEDQRRHTQDFHDHHHLDMDRRDRTLFAVIDALDESQIPYGFIGGTAVKELGRPRVTSDIDLFVSPDDAERVLEILAQKGFSTEKRDPHWLYKAWREDVLVDVIFKSSGDIYFDSEMASRVKSSQYHGRSLKTVSPEDFIVIKSAVASEHNSHHWYDALAVLTRGNLDWDYLIKKSKHSPRRVLSLLVFAQSNDISVPNEVIGRLFQALYQSKPVLSQPSQTSTIFDVLDKEKDSQLQPQEHTNSPVYLQGRIREALARDERTADHNILILISGNRIVARGEVYSEEQQQAIEAVVRLSAPGYTLDNQVRVLKLSEPQESEIVL